MSEHDRDKRTLPHFNHLLRGYRKRARERRVEWGLSPYEFRILIKGECRFCGSPPRQIYDRYKGRQNVKDNTPLIYNGIDRLDPDKGYILSNCVSCCWVCNNMKARHSEAEFYEHIEKIKRHRRKKGSSKKARKKNVSRRSRR